MTKPAGWRREPARHALAAKGVKTKTTYRDDYPSGQPLHDQKAGDPPEFLESSEKSTVVFRKYPDGDVIALFPLMPTNPVSLEPLVTSYMHVGQHSDANYQYVITQTVPATPAEYHDLAKELGIRGYKGLVVKKRVAYADMTKAREDLRQFYERQGM